MLLHDAGRAAPHHHRRDPDLRRVDNEQVTPASPTADYARVIESEPEAYGDRGSSHVKSTRRAWTASCTCGWHAGSGAGWAWFRTKRAANAAWEQHAHLPPNEQVGDG